MMRPEQEPPGVVVLYNVAEVNCDGRSCRNDQEIQVVAATAPLVIAVIGRKRK